MTMNNVDFRPITAENFRVLKAAPNGEGIPYASLGRIVLLGLEHDPAAARIVINAGNRANHGVIRVTKPDRNSTEKGTLRVAPFRGSQADRADFIAGVKLFTAMKVEFA
jgi:hypothetical protein